MHKSVAEHLEEVGSTARIYSSRQATHSMAMNVSVASLLVRLADKYRVGAKSEDINEKLISEEQTEETLSQLKARIDQRIADDKAHSSSDCSSYEAALAYFQKICIEAPNDFDFVTLEVTDKDSKAKEEKILFPLTKVIALVYLAVTDSHVYEDNSEEAQRGRWQSLLDCMKDVAQHPRCHTGIRHELANLSNRIYPDVSLIQDIEAYLYNKMTDFFQNILKHFKRNNPDLYKEIILIEFKLKKSENLRHSELARELPQGNELFKTEIIKELQSHQIIMDQALINKINNYLAMWDEFSLPTSDDQVLRILQAISELKFENDNSLRNNVLELVRRWIVNKFDFEKKSIHSLLAFYQTTRILELIKKYQKLLETLPGEPLYKKSIAELQKNVDSFYQNCVEKDSLLAISADIVEDMEAFNSACNLFNRDQQEYWIKDIFVLWHRLSEDNDITSLRKLYATLLSEPMQQKYLVTDEWLNQIFQQQPNRPIELTPYLTNRVFLHAIVTPVESWTPRFAELLSHVYTFVNDNFNQGEEHEMAWNSKDLKKDSYPQALKKQIDYLIKLYSFHQNDEEENSAERIEPLPPENFFIPLYHSGISKVNFTMMITILPNDQIMKFIKKFDNKIVKNFVMETDLFRSLIARLSRDDIEEFINFMGISNIENWVHNYEKLKILTLVLDKNKIQKIINIAGVNFIAKFATNKERFQYILSFIPKDNQLMVIKNIHIYFLETVVDNYEFLTKILKLMAKKDRIAFLQHLKVNFVKSLIKNKIGTIEGLVSFLFMFNEIDRHRLIEFFLLDETKFSIKNKDELIRVINFIPKSDRLNLLKLLGNEYLLNLIASYEDLCAIMFFLPEEDKIKFLNFFPIGKIKELIDKNFNRFRIISSFLSTEDQYKFIESLGRTYIENFFKNYDDLIAMSLDKNFQNFINFLGSRGIKKLIIDPIKLIMMVNNLTDNLKLGFIKSLGIEFINNIIKNNDLLFFTKYIPKSERIDFFRFLDIKNNKNYSIDIPSLIKLLPHKDRIIFIKELGSAYIKINIKNDVDLLNILKEIFNKDQKEFFRFLGQEYFNIFNLEQKKILECMGTTSFNNFNDFFVYLKTENKDNQAMESNYSDEDDPIKLKFKNAITQFTSDNQADLKLRQKINAFKEINQKIIKHSWNTWGFFSWSKPPKTINEVLAEIKAAKVKGLNQENLENTIVAVYKKLETSVENPTFFRTKDTQNQYKLLKEDFRKLCLSKANI